MKLKVLLRQTIAFGLLLFSVMACKDKEPDMPPAPSFDITLKESSLGKILADNKGMSLYFFANDVKGASTCTGTCLTNWPAFTVENLRVDTGLTGADFGSVPTADGKKQVTYKGWPLYYYKSDLVAGDVKGENVGNIWYVAKTTYSLMLANAQLIGADGKNYIIDAGVYKEGTGNSLYYTDNMGITLYGFANDKKNKNSYTQEDPTKNTAWPIYNTEIVDLPSAIDKTLFGKIKVWGSDQLTYKGWPLYYFGTDGKVRGVNKGVSAGGAGKWPIVNKDTPVAPDAPVPNIMLKETTLGKVLTDSKGMTLYFFATDVKGGVSTCTGGCLTNWPIFAMDNLVLDAGLLAADFGNIVSPDGKKHITYKGWPLYYYINDTAAGDVKGENVGSVWYVAKPTYSLMLAKTQLVGNDGKNYIIDAGVYKEGTGATTYYTDNKGNTIYGFANDKKDTNTYTNVDPTKNTAWPIYYSAIVDLPSAMDKALFGKITVFGNQQLTYKGWPLYYFGPDGMVPGVNKGVSVGGIGKWPVVNKETPVAP